jgi:hypothetical protein
MNKKIKSIKKQTQKGRFKQGSIIRQKKGAKVKRK